MTIEAHASPIMLPSNGIDLGDYIGITARGKDLKTYPVHSQPRPGCPHPEMLLTVANGECLAWGDQYPAPMPRRSIRGKSIP
jgi:hypothetical protein